MPNYRDVQSAVRVEKFRIWFAWLCGGIIALIVAEATKDIHIVSTIVQVVLAVLGIAFTIAAMRATNALNEKADKARREVLGDDYPG
jgi:heme O synthase-like polyprenyltransferase